MHKIINNGIKNLPFSKCKVKMFSKTISGELNNSNRFYANWEFNFVFEDEIKSANIKHSLDIEK
jgi:hypothetical protein